MPEDANLSYLCVPPHRPRLRPVVCSREPCIYRVAVQKNLGPMSRSQAQAFESKAHLAINDKFIFLCHAVLFCSINHRHGLFFHRGNWRCFFYPPRFHTDEIKFWDGFFTLKVCLRFNNHRLKILI